MKRDLKFIILIVTLLSETILVFGQPIPVPQNNLRPRPVIIPIPEKTAGVQTPVISLNGIWKINMDPPAEFWLNTIDISSWKEMIVPASADKFGIRIQPDKQYTYRTKFKVPADFEGKRIFLRFEGVTGTARAYVNGNFLKEHFGGFNIWNCDITQYVKPGEETLLTIGIVEESKRTSSGFNTGGIIRSVKLIALPQDYLMRFNIETDFDDSYKNATMKVWIGADFNKSERISVVLTLKAPDGKPVAIKPASVTLSKNQNEIIVPIIVSNPIKWDAEHPELYTLAATINEKGKLVETVSKKIGFREVEIKGKKMFVNGLEIKLRGGGRFDSDPVYGKYLSPEQSFKEVRMLKNANLNFVRPSCYPTTEDYFDACDSIGLYVQAENAVTFARGSQNDTTYTDIYMSQMAEMIEADRSHPSIIIWELANETGYGINIDKTHDYARAEDPSRPVIYSWSQSVPPDKPWPYEIFSYHYPDWDQDLGKSGVAVFNGKAARQLPEGMPVLHDEFAHGSAYYPVSLARDPGMRNFWGESIKRFWERMFNTDGCLGGAIWAVIDENAIGGWAYEWGMIDLWRRERPEYWLMKKAYSPVRIDEKPLEIPSSGKPLVIHVKNWYDHTDFSELTFHWSVGNKRGTLKGPDLAPHNNGKIEIPGLNVTKNDILNLKVYDKYGMYTDEFNLAFAPFNTGYSAPTGPHPAIKEDNNFVTVKGSDFEILFRKSDGMIEKGSFKGKVIIKGGPYFNLVGGSPLKQWKFRSITTSSNNEEAIVKVSGTSDPVDITFDIKIDSKGLITTKYTLNKFGVVPPKATKVPWNNQDGGGFEEVGVAYLLTEDIDQFSWNRKGLWSVYPENHIGRTQGTAQRHIPGPLWKFGTKPTRPWSLDEHDFSVFGIYDIGGRGSNDFRSMKENIYFGSASDSKSDIQVRAESNGSDAVRLEVVPDKSKWVDNNNPGIVYSGDWKPVNDTLEYFKEKELRSSKEGDFAEFTFTGTGICWIGTKGNIYGSADVFIDGTPAVAGLNFSSRGLSGPQAVLYSKTGLSSGPHKIKIVARPAGFGRGGIRNQPVVQSGGPAIPLDAFQVLDEKPLGGDVKIIINNQWNYTKMGLGNYMKEPILIKDGFAGSIQLRILSNELK